MSEPATTPPHAVRRQIEMLLQAWGLTEQHARETADVLLYADVAGIDSHGISVMPMYEQMLKEGKVDPAGSPSVLRQSATTALIDAGANLGHPASVFAMNLAIEKALASDVGVVCVINSHHFGAAGYYARMAADRGLVGLITSSTRFVSLVPTFGAEPVLGTNPLAFGAPAKRNPPVILDMATSVVAIQKIRVYSRRGEPLPEGWVVDGEGRSVTDPEQALQYILQRHEGGLNPVGGDMVMGGHKGYGLALMVHLLASTLCGGSFSPVRNCTARPSDPENIGHFFLALNPSAFRAIEEYEHDVDEVIDTLRATRPSRPGRPVLVPGDPERLTGLKRKDGIPLPAVLREQIRTLCTRAGVEYCLD